MSLTAKRQLPNINHEKIRQLNLIHEYQMQNTKRHIEDNENFLTQQNSTTLLECAKSIRENVVQYKNHLIRNDGEYKKQIQKDDDLSLLLNRRRRKEQDYLQLENDYLIEQKKTLSNSATLNEMLSFKKELEKSERQCEQLSNHLESVMKTCNEKDKIISKSSLELKEITENCDTYERQNMKLQHDLKLALEKLEEMTEEAEKFAQESFHSQKQLADAEQKREEFQIQGQESIKQSKARIKKFEKDIERYKLDSAQMLEKNEQLIKELDTFKSQNSSLKEQLIKIEIDLNESNINYQRLEEQFKLNENNIIQLRSIRSTQETEITTLKKKINELEKQVSTQQQYISQTNKEKVNLQGLLQEEINHRNSLNSKLKQSEQDIELINTSRYQFQQQIIETENQRINLLKQINEIQLEKDILLKEKTKFLAIENDYEELKKNFETMKIDYTRNTKVLQLDYENKIETLQLQLSDGKARIIVLQRQDLENKKEIERLQEKSAKYEDEATQGQCTIETLSRENSDKSRLIDEIESKLAKLTVEITNQKNQFIKKDKDYQNSLHTIYNDIIYCTECLSNNSNKPFIIEHSTISYDDTEIWLSKIKAHLTWLKQELEIRQQQENKLREDLNNALLDCETDRKYFTSELAKREVIIHDLSNNHQDLKREISNTQFDIQNEFNKQRLLTENERDHIDDRYRQFQIMIDSVKRELHTAKIQLLS